MDNFDSTEHTKKAIDFEVVGLEKEIDNLTEEYIRRVLTDEIVKMAGKLIPLIPRSLIERISPHIGLFGPNVRLKYLTEELYRAIAKSLAKNLTSK